MTRPKNFYERVRSILDKTEEELTNQFIEINKYFEIASSIVENKVPNIELIDIDSKKYIFLETVLIYETAKQIIPISKQKFKTQQTTAAKVEYFEEKNEEITNSIEDMLSYLYKELNPDLETGIKVFLLS